MSNSHLPVVEILKITRNNQLAYLSWQFPTPALKQVIYDGVERLLKDDTTGIAPVRHIGVSATDFCFELLRPLADDRTVDGLIRALAKQYGFRVEVVTITEEEADAAADSILEKLLNPEH